jgi:hypothetical protein
LKSLMISLLSAVTHKFFMVSGIGLTLASKKGSIFC